MSGQLSIKSNCYNRKPCDTILPEYLQTLKETLEVVILFNFETEFVSASYLISLINFRLKS